MTERAASRRRPWPRRAALPPVILVVVWCGGFLWFLHAADRPAALYTRADGIVVLTGGADRVEEGLRLLAEGKADHLLISGIGGKAHLQELEHGAGVDVASLAERVTLGREAMSTHGNALETAAWVRDHRIETLVVVTAWFHMPRALVELHRTLPTVMLLAEPVHPQRGPNRPEPGFSATARLLVAEYTKYLIAVAGLTTYLPEREGPHSP